MPIFSATTLARFFNQGEQNISQEKPFLVDRTSFAVTKGTNVYVLPDYVSSIRRITYLGWKLDPLPARTHREVFQSATQIGRPFWYIFNNIGIRSIQFFPGIPTNLAQCTDLWNQSGTDSFKTGVVVEFARITDNSTFIVPTYLRRQLLKQYTASQCFAIEGSGQNLKMAQYFTSQWEKKKGLFFQFLSDLHGKSRKLIVSEIVSSNYFPASPVLPIANFGQPVDEGY